MLKFLEMLSSDDEQRAFQLVYEENYLKMYYVALNMLNDKPRAEAAVNNALFKLAESYSNYRSYSQAKMRSLCVLMTKQSAIDIIRKEKNINLKAIGEIDGSIKSVGEHNIENISPSKEKSMLKRAL